MKKYQEYLEEKKFTLDSELKNLKNSIKLLDKTVSNLFTLRSEISGGQYLKFTEKILKPTEKLTKIDIPKKFN